LGHTTKVENLWERTVETSLLLENSTGLLEELKLKLCFENEGDQGKQK
jgi:hypothetical protein